jgi:hypothetical protein
VNANLSDKYVLLTKTKKLFTSPIFRITTIESSEAIVEELVEKLDL